jgi:hypothetical protein
VSFPRRLAPLGLALALAAGAGAQVFRHGRFEQALKAAAEIADPLRGEVLVEFAAPGVAPVDVAAFWDGGRDWKVRFSPEKTGAWKWRVKTAGFEPASGAFQAGEYKGANVLYRRGAPRVASGGRHFAHADGTPWFWLSCTGWNAALLSTRQEWDRYLADRAQKRFTAIQFVMTQWRAGRQDELGQVAFTAGGGLRVNPAFFRRMDQKFDALNERGLVAAPVLLWALTSKDQESPGVALSTEDAIQLARYMVARYGAHQAIWILGGDGEYRGAAAERWKAIGRAVFPEGRPHHPATLHPRGMNDPWPEYQDEPWLGFFMYQTGHGSDARKWRWNATQGPATGWKLEPPHPVVDGEPNYEGHLSYQGQRLIDDAAVRRAVYYSLLGAPPAGVTYGAHGIWFWSRQAEVPLDHPRTGVALPWHECLDYPGARQMRVMRDIFDRVEWWKLRPDRALLAEDAADAEFRDYIQPARSEDGRFALIYLPDNPVVKLNLSKFARPMAASWFDPRTGKETPAGKLTPELKTPGAGDWLLMLR